jgi:hypothetical protein
MYIICIYIYIHAYIDINIRILQYVYTHTYRLFLCCVLQLSQQLVGIGIITILGTDFLEILETPIVLLGLGVAYLSALLGTLLGLLKVSVYIYRYICV